MNLEAFISCLFSSCFQYIVLGDNSRMCTILIHVHWMKTCVISELGAKLHTMHLLNGKKLMFLVSNIKLLVVKC
jgi:hypothetical protein